MKSRRSTSAGWRGKSVLAALAAVLLTFGCDAKEEHGHAHGDEGHEHGAHGHNDDQHGDHPHGEHDEDAHGHDHGDEGHEHGADGHDDHAHETPEQDAHDHAGDDHHAHDEAHDHGGHGEPATESVTMAAERLELFMEHPYLVVGEGAKFNVHLTVLADGMPIRSGKLRVLAKGPSGKTVSVVQERPRSPGIYGPTIAFPEAGRNVLSLDLVSEQATEAIRVPVTVYSDRAAANRAAAAAGEGEPEGAITFLKEQAWKIGLIVEPAVRRRLVERLVVPGEIRPAAGAKVVVTPPLAGRLLLPHGGSFPRVGERVEAGQVVAVVQGLQSDLGEKLREAENDIRTAKIALDHARAVYERQKALVTSEAISRGKFEETEREFRTAEANYQARLEARKVYEQSRMSSQSGAGAPGGKGGRSEKRPDTLPSSLLPLRAPIAGTVTDAAATEGEYVDPSHTLFTVIDLGRVWVEAKVSEFDLKRVEKAPGASLTLAAYPDRRFDAVGEGRGRLIDVGSVIDVRTRTLPVRYELENPEGIFRVGMLAEVAVETSRAIDAVAVPESAIVDEDGHPTAYVLLDGEHFLKRDLELGIRDSGSVEVRRGIAEGERVVTKGGYAIRLASVSSVIPAHGHAH